MLLVLGGLAACSQTSEHAPPPSAKAAALDDSSRLEQTELSVAACVGTEVAAEALPVDVFAVLDGSGSMAEATQSGVSKWYATKAAFRDFLQQAPSSMGFGLSIFPGIGPGTTSCRNEDYRLAALAIDDVHRVASGAVAMLDAVQPQGQTPTAPALSAALDSASAHAMTHPERSVVVVLATDGLPTACEPMDASALAGFAKEALDGPGHVRTLVVATSSLTPGDASGFGRIALAGGTLRPVVIDPRQAFASQLTSTLNATAARQVACDMALPEPPPGKRLDYDTVNVLLDGRDRQTLPRVSGASACNEAGGWYYDVDPTRGAPSRLNVCQATCARVTAATLRVELGCQTRVR